MSILIKGMKMPTARDTLVLVKTDGTAIVYEDEAYETTAAHVPPHGRLIDADALEEEPCDVVEDRFSYAVFGHSNDQIRNAPTIIERDRH